MQELARRLGLAGFWGWWTAQLDPLVPAAPRAALARRRMRPILVFEGDHATLWRPALEQGRAVMKQATTIALTGDMAAIGAAGRAALSPLTPMVYGGSSVAPRVVIAVPAREVLRKTIVLPAAVEENLRQALTYDLDRHTPFKADELYFDAVVSRRDAARGTVEVDLAAVRRNVVDPALKHAAAWGADVAAVIPAASDLTVPSRVNLLPFSMRASRSIWRRWQFWVPFVLVVTLAIAAIVIPLWQKRDFAIQLNTLADQARAQAAVSETLRLELDGKVADYNTALERKYAYPGALQTVDYVSKLLPDDTWLTQLELKNVTKGKEVQREVLVRGETGNAGRLVQLFEDSQHFAQAAPRAPTTKIQPGPGEIFDFGAQLKPRTAPSRAALIVRDPAPDAGAPATTPPPAGAIAPAAPAPSAPVPPPGAGSAAISAPVPAASTPPPAAAGTPAAPTMGAAPLAASPSAAAPKPASGKVPDQPAGRKP
ncbi:MAG: pilus assembly protein PilM [Betaproteobacteria bacterium]